MAVPMSQHVKSARSLDACPSGLVVQVQMRKNCAHARQPRWRLETKREAGSWKLSDSPSRRLGTIIEELPERLKCGRRVYIFFPVRVSRAL